MLILAGVTSDQSVVNLFDKARQIAVRIFDPSDTDSIGALLSQYDELTVKIEDILRNRISSRIISDEDSYELVRQAGLIQGIEEGELLAGTFKIDRSDQVIATLGTILGIENTYYLAVKSMVKEIKEGDLLVFWNIGEEKKNEIFTA